ncbi:thioredoxin H2-like [Rhodamnia argentea]|uniref:Thioredoxin H2-like n=1 Tax=Rhodamnia argentea TaxID=178133 RepID=A0A8B8ML29_9MYRT|nr:thioredoxin H2-like [Rhodamnia argentea]
MMMMGRSMSSGNYYDWAPAKTSRVMAFHSKSRWEEHFDASKGTNKLMVIYFTATWCGPCRWMEPTIDELAAAFADVDFIKIDVDELMNVSRQFGVQAMPTFLLMKNGKVVDKVVGAKKDELRNKIEQHSNKSQPYLRSNSYPYAYRYAI